MKIALRVSLRDFLQGGKVSPFLARMICPPIVYVDFCVHADWGRGHRFFSYPISYDINGLFIGKVLAGELLVDRNNDMALLGCIVVCFPQI